MRAMAMWQQPLTCGLMRAAAMAQRKGELLKLETLERIASLLTELQQDAVMAEACSEAGDGCPIR